MDNIQKLGGEAIGNLVGGSKGEQGYHNNPSGGNTSNDPMEQVGYQVGYKFGQMVGGNKGGQRGEGHGSEREYKEGEGGQHGQSGQGGLGGIGQNLINQFSGGNKEGGTL